MLILIRTHCGGYYQHCYRNNLLNIVQTARIAAVLVSGIVLDEFHTTGSRQQFISIHSWHLEMYYCVPVST